MKWFALMSGLLSNAVWVLFALQLGLPKSTLKAATSNSREVAEIREAENAEEEKNTETVAENEEKGAPDKDPAHLFLLPELIVNVPSEDLRSHTLGIQLEIEMFEPKTKPRLKQHLAILKNSVIEASLENTYFELRGLPGKYLLKEHIIQRINTAYNEPIVKDIHFVRFLLK